MNGNETNDNAPLRIMIAEDNPALGSVVQFNLERAGYEASVACNGQRAWDLARASEFDLIITDQQMPELDGIELCRRLRGHPRYTHTPIIMLTAKGLELNLNSFQRELMVTAVIAKPFSPRELVDTVTDTLSKPLLSP